MGFEPMKGSLYGKQPKTFKQTVHKNRYTNFASTYAIVLYRNT